MLHELRNEDMDHLKKALSLLSEDEEEEGAEVTVTADSLRALIAAYELVGKQWRDLIKDYERVEHRYEALLKKGKVGTSVGGQTKPSTTSTAGAAKSQSRKQRVA